MDSGVMTPAEWARAERMIMENRVERERLNQPDWLASLGERRADAMPRLHG